MRTLDYLSEPGFDVHTAVGARGQVMGFDVVNRVYEAPSDERQWTALKYGGCRPCTSLKVGGVYYLFFVSTYGEHLTSASSARPRETAENQYEIVRDRTNVESQDLVYARDYDGVIEILEAKSYPPQVGEMPTAEEAQCKEILVQPDLLATKAALLKFAEDSGIDLRDLLESAARHFSSPAIAPWRTELTDDEINGLIHDDEQALGDVP